jgi:pyruvate kinase
MPRIGQHRLRRLLQPRLAAHVGLLGRDHLDGPLPALGSRRNVGVGIMIGDGAIQLRIERVTATTATARILTGGRTQGRPGVHLPSERLRLRTPTDDDLRLAKIMAGEGADFLAVSFVRAAADLKQVRARLAEVVAIPA